MLKLALACHQRVNLRLSAEGNYTRERGVGMVTQFSARPQTVNKARHSLWIQEALALETGDDAPELVGPTSAEVCIVGGGYTGLWTALRIKELEPQASVVLLEADICGAAASGRNGGMALSWWPKIETLIARLGESEGLRLARASEWAVSQLGAFCDSNGIDAHFKQRGWLWTATSSAQINAWAGAVKACAALDAYPFQPMTAEEVRRATGSPVHLAGIFESGAATVQPALLARGLRRVALERGIHVYEHSPMLSFNQTSGIVTTPLGSVKAATIVIAMNAYAAKLRELRRVIEPLGSDMVATEPIPQDLERSGWIDGASISNSRLMVHYYRTTRDGRIAFGRGGGALGMAGRIGPDFDYNSGRSHQVTADLRRLAPAASDARITHAWGGAVDRSPDGLPVFGQLHGGGRVLYGVGFSGNGVAPTYIGGRILASTALERRDEWSECGLNQGIPSRFPPEPFRYVGGLLVRRAVQRKECLEDTDRSADPVTRRLAALAPSGYFKVTPENKRI